LIIAGSSVMSDLKAAALGILGGAPRDLHSLATLSSHSVVPNKPAVSAGAAEW
jgi:hypothetical protein